MVSEVRVRVKVWFRVRVQDARVTFVLVVPGDARMDHVAHVSGQQPEVLSRLSHVPGGGVCGMRGGEGENEGEGG